MLIDELKKAQMEALKTKDTLKRSVLQIVTGKVKLAEIEKRTKANFTDIPELAFNLYCNCFCCHKFVFFCLADGYE